LEKRTSSADEIQSRRKERWSRVEAEQNDRAELKQSKAEQNDRAEQKHSRTIELSKSRAEI
jgi:hypothetical protein